MSPVHRLFRKHYQIPFDTCVKHLQKVQTELDSLNMLKPYGNGSNSNNNSSSNGAGGSNYGGGNSNWVMLTL